MKKFLKLSLSLILIANLSNNLNSMALNRPFAFEQFKEDIQSRAKNLKSVTTKTTPKEKSSLMEDYLKNNSSVINLLAKAQNNFQQDSNSLDGDGFGADSDEWDNTPSNFDITTVDMSKVQQQRVDELNIQKKNTQINPAISPQKTNSTTTATNFMSSFDMKKNNKFKNMHMASFGKDVKPEKPIVRQARPLPPRPLKNDPKIKNLIDQMNQSQGSIIPPHPKQDNINDKPQDTPIQQPLNTNQIPLPLNLDHSIKVEEKPFIPPYPDQNNKTNVNNEKKSKKMVYIVAGVAIGIAIESTIILYNLIQTSFAKLIKKQIKTNTFNASTIKNERCKNLIKIFEKEKMLENRKQLIKQITQIICQEIPFQEKSKTMSFIVFNNAKRVFYKIHGSVKSKFSRIN